jgi:hypothetical protein
MKDHARENLTELLRRFMDDSAAHSVQADIDAAEKLLEAHPAPAPSPAALTAIKVRMVATAVRRHRRVRIFRAAVAVAAAMLLTVLIGQFDRTPTGRPGISFASIIPTAVWESHDLTADDLDLVYFNSEIRQIEAQMQAIEAGEAEQDGSDSVDELELELIAIETEFWKG